jgi:TolB-like protein/Flp pilus assembly protein TadD
MSLLTELSRRKVWKVGAAYLVVAWLAVQAASIAFPAFDAPAWALRIFILVAFLGFPIALIFAWAFDVTPEGVKVDAASPSSRVILLVAAGFVALAFTWYFKGQPSYRDVAGPGSAAGAATAAAKGANPAPAAIGEKSIAVMPFLNMSADKDQDYFSDGMTEEILNALAKVPKLEVTARTSVFSLKGQRHDVRELGKMLGVAYLLEGSVRKAGDEVRITAQLVRTDNGFHLWSETYDRKLENVFALQAELAGAIAQALQLPLGIGGSDALVSERTADPEAYSLYLQARSAYRTRGDGVKQSIELYRAAVKRDPKFAKAWAGLCSSLVVLPWYVSDVERANTPEFMREAEQAGKQALALAPDLPEAHTALATLYTFEWKWAAAEQHFQRALALAPDDPEVHYNYADWLGAQGRFEEALQASQRTIALDPLVPIFMNGLANNLGDAGRADEALAQRQAAYALAPDVGLIRNNLFRTYVRAGRLDDAEKMLDQSRASALARAARDGVKGDPQQLAHAMIRLKRDPGLAETIHKELGDEDFRKLQLAMATVADDIDTTFEELESAFDKHVSGADPVIALRRSKLNAYRKDPRYLRLLNKAGVDDEGKLR